MHAQFFTTAAAITLAIFNRAVAQDIDNDDIPRQCSAVCGSLVTAANDCERATGDDEGTRYVNCLCTATNAQNVIQLCEACVYSAEIQDGESDRDARDNDVNDILRACSIATTSYDLASSVTPTAAMTANTSGTTGSQSATASSVTPTGSQSASLSSAIGSTASIPTVPTGTGTPNAAAFAKNDAHVGGAFIGGAFALFGAVFA